MMPVALNGLIMFLCEKTTKYKEKVRAKSKTAISGIFPGISTVKKLFSKIGLGHVMSIANMHLRAKNWKKLMTKSREMAKKSVFRHIFGISGRKNTFFKIRHWSHFRHWHFASACQISCKNIQYSSRNSRGTIFPAKIGCSGDF